MGRGFFEITPELIASVLLLPEGMNITNIRKCDKMDNLEPDVYHMTVEDEHIRNEKLSDGLPRVELKYETRHDSDGTKREVILSGWTTS